MALLQAYEIPAKAEFDIQLPQGAQVISFYNLDNKPYIGVLVDIAAPALHGPGPPRVDDQEGRARPDRRHL